MLVIDVDDELLVMRYCVNSRAVPMYRDLNQLKNMCLLTLTRNGIIESELLNIHSCSNSTSNCATLQKKDFQRFASVKQLI